jgi:hypothetical protein
VIQGSTLRRLLIGVVLVVSLNLTPAVAQASSLQLNPMSLSFPTPHFGYVLSFYKCAGKTCAALRSTDDAGSSWSVVPTPSQINKDLRILSWGAYNTSYAYATLNVHFADAQNGWIYGSVPTPNAKEPSYPNWVYRLWSTHDGGKTWRQIRLGPLSLSGGVVQMATHGSWTYLFGGSDTSALTYILTTPSNVDRWTDRSSAQMGMPAGGTELQGEFSFAGSSGLFVAGNDRGFTASARLSNDGSWRFWKGPSFEDFGASFTPIAGVTRKVLLAEGESAGFVIPPPSTVPPGWNNSASWLFISYDAGATFKPLRELSSSYQRGYFSVPGLPATPVPGTILLQQTKGSGLQLVRSTNWGRTWKVVINRSVSQVVFTSRATGYAVVLQGTSQSVTSLFVTHDAGANWSRVSI